MTAQYSDPEQPPAGGPPAKDKRRFTIGQVVGLLVVIVLIVFIAENTNEVDVRLIGPKVNDVPLSVALVIAALLGALITWLLMWRRSRHKGN